MKLSRQESAILAVLAEHGSIPITDVAKLARLQVHSVRYALNRLIERQVIQPYTYINSQALGYLSYSFYFSISSRDAKSRQRFIDTLVNRQDIAWVAQLSGDYQFACTGLYRNSWEVEELISTVMQVEGITITNKVFRTEFLLTYFPFKFYLPPGRKSTVVKWGNHKTITQIDNTDALVLSALSKQRNLTHAELARRIGMPVSTFHDRIQKLVEKGVIDSFTYFLNIDKTNLHCYKIIISLKKYSLDFKESLLNFCHIHPNVDLLVHCASEWDFEINFHVDNAQQINLYVQQLEQNFGEYIGSIRALQILEHIKVINYPFDVDTAVEKKRSDSSMRIAANT